MEAQTRPVVETSAARRGEHERGATGLVVGLVAGHSLVHLRLAGSDVTVCGRGTALEWPSKTFRSSGCFSCLGAALEAGHVGSLDSDGRWLDLRRLAM